MDSLKSDNQHLLELLKDTCEYADFSDNDILKSAMTKRLKGSKGYNSTFEANRHARGVPPLTERAKSAGKRLVNDWIPTEAVNALVEIQKEQNGQLNERAVSEILYRLNMIWRNIMRQEIDA